MLPGYVCGRPCLQDPSVHNSRDAVLAAVTGTQGRAHAFEPQRSIELVHQRWPPRALINKCYHVTAYTLDSNYNPLLAIPYDHLIA